MSLHFRLNIGEHGFGSLDVGGRNTCPCGDNAVVVREATHPLLRNRVHGHESIGKGANPETDGASPLQRIITGKRFQFRDPGTNLVELITERCALGGALLFGKVEVFDRSVQLHEIIGEHSRLCVPHDRLNCLRFPGDIRLPAERRELTSDLSRQIIQPREVGLHGFELPLSLFFAPAVLQNSRGFFNESSTVVGARVQNLVELSLTHDDVHFATESTVAQKLLNIEQATRFFVDRVFGSTVSKQRSRNRDFRVVDRQCTIRVVDREDDLCSTERCFGGRAGKYDILHRATAERFRPLLPHHPRERVHHV